MSRDLFECLIEALENPVVEQNGSPDPPSAYYIPPQVAQWFVDAARRFQNSDIKSLERALDVLRPPGRPVDPDTSEKVDLAETALAYKVQGKTWAQINGEIFSDRPDPPDERYIRTLIDQYKPQVMVRQLHRRWLSRSEERKQRSFLKNSRRGKPDSNPR
jgi:hypothetical protein